MDMLDRSVLPYNQPLNEQTEKSRLAQAPHQSSEARREGANRSGRSTRLDQQRKTTVDENGLPADHGRGVGTQESDRLRQVFWFHHATCGRARGRLIDHVASPRE